MKAIGYARVSTDLQDFNRQLTQIEDHCRANNYELIEIYKETGSGKNDDRTELTRMKAFIQSSTDLDFLIISELSRLGRNSKTGETLDLLNKKGVGLISKKENINTLNEDKTINYSASLILNIINSINGFELNTLSYRVKDGHRAATQTGRANGSLNITYGYRKEGLKKQSKLIIDEKEAEVIKTIFNKYLEVGTSGVVKYLNDNIETIPTRAQTIIEKYPEKVETYKASLKWSKESVYAILKNSMYIGQRKHRTTKIEGKNKTKYNYEYFDHSLTMRIIENDIYNRVQERLKNSYSKGGKHTTHEYLLSTRKVKCGCCKHYYITHTLASKKEKARYVCSSTRKETCGNFGIKIESIDRLVQSVIFNNYSDILLNSLSNSDQQTEIENLNSILDQYKKELEKVLKLEYNFIDKIDRFTPEVFNKKLDEIQDVQKKVRKSIEQTEKQLRDNKEAFERLTNISKLNKKFNTKNEQLPAPIVNTILNSITITRIDKCHKELQNLIPIIYQNYEEFNFDATLHKQDRLMLIQIKAGNTTLDYIIAQQNFFAYDIQKKNIFVHGFHAEKLSGTWFHHLKNVNYSNELIRWLKLKAIN